MRSLLPLLLALSLLSIAMLTSATFQEVAAGVAIFLFGMGLLEQGFRAFAGGALERVLGVATKTLPRSLGFGFLTTSLMQSSSLVTVLTISFLSAGLLGLTEGVGIIFGANIGTTTGAWLMAAFGMKVKLSAYSMPMLVLGLVLTMQRGVRAKGLGRVLAGVGFLFLGIHFMKEGFEGLQASIDLASWSLQGTLGLVVYTLVGAAATVVMQSSHATLMLIIAALSSQQLTYEAALALAIGANVGTTVTAVLGAMGSNAAGRRLAAAHLVFNAATGALALVFIGAFRSGVEVVAGGLGLAADDWTLRLAIFHTLFNVVGVLVMLPGTGTLVRWLEQRFEGPADDAEAPLHLNEAALGLPDTALEVVHREAQHLFDVAFHILAHSVGLRRGDVLSRADLEAMLDFEPELLQEDALDAYYRRVKTVYGGIVEFSARAQEGMSPEQVEELWGLRVACRNIARAVKLTTAMGANISAAQTVPAPAVRRQYRALRLHLALTLRRLYAIRATEGPAAQLIAFERLRLRAGRRESESDRQVDAAVRAGQLSSRAATSLMNDWDTVRQVVQLLREAAEQVFVPRGSVLGDLRDELLGGDEPAPSAADTLTLDRLVSQADITAEYQRVIGRPRGDQAPDS